MNDKRYAIIAIFLWICLSIFALVRFAETVHPRYDSGAYIIAAKSLASGQGLRHLAHPENPPFTTYPPIIPALLAPFAKIDSGDFNAIKAGMIIIFSLTLFYFIVFFKDHLPLNRLIAATAVLGTGSLLAFAGRLQGEVPFTLFGLASVCLADRFLKRPSIGRLAAAVAAIFVLCYSRQAGIAWAAGFMLACVVSPMNRDLEKRRALIWRAGAIIAIIALVVVPWALLIQKIQPGSLSPKTSSMLRNEGWDPDKGRMGLVSRSMLGRIKMNVVGSATFAPESFFYKYQLSSNKAAWILFAPILLLMIAGFAKRAIRKRSVIETITVAYCGLIWISPWLREPRFFTVLLPFLILYLSEGQEFFFSAFKKQDASKYADKVFIGICIVIVIVNVVSVFSDDHINPWSAKQNQDYLLAKFSEKHLPKDAVVLAHDHCAFYLLTGRKSLSFTKSEQKFLPQYKLDAYLKRGGRADYIAWADSDKALVNGFLDNYGYKAETVAKKDDLLLQKLIR